MRGRRSLIGSGPGEPTSSDGATSKVQPRPGAPRAAAATAYLARSGSLQQPDGEKNQHGTSVTPLTLPRSWQPVRLRSFGRPGSADALGCSWWQYRSLS